MSQIASNPLAADLVFQVEELLDLIEQLKNDGARLYAVDRGRIKAAKKAGAR